MIKSTEENYSMIMADGLLGTTEENISNMKAYPEKLP